MTTDSRSSGYRVEAERSGDWWAITVPSLSGLFSQAKRLDQVEATAREAIAMMLDTDESSVGLIEVAVTPPAAVVNLMAELKKSVAVASEASHAAATTRRRVAQLMRDEGLPMRDVGELLGVSHQRVSQILAS